MQGDRNTKGMSRMLELVHNGVDPHDCGGDAKIPNAIANGKQAGWVIGAHGGPYQLTPEGRAELVRRIPHYGVSR